MDRISADRKQAGAVPERGCACFAPDNAAVIMTKYAGLRGSVRIVREKKAELSACFSPFLLVLFEKLEKECGTEKEEEQLERLRREKAADPLVHFCGEGGVYEALWRLTKDTGRGFVIPEEDIPVLQETIELCNFYDIDPMRLDAGGSLLVTVPAEQADVVLRAMEEAEIPAFLIGHLTKALAKRIESGEAVRFLDRPQPDELTKLGVQTLRNI